MILLDTSVVSEPMCSGPDTRVIEWIEAQPLEPLFLSAITVTELRAVVALLTVGKRMAGLQTSLASADGCIAAIAAANGLAVATRDTGAFEAAGAAVITPWEA